MTVVDTSVWIEHFRGTSRARPLAPLLESNDVLLHAWVLGELALGSLGAHRSRVLTDLRKLPRAPILGDEEVLALVERRRLHGRGMGWVDAHLLGSALVADADLWSFDLRLTAAAAALGARVRRDP